MSKVPGFIFALLLAQFAHSFCSTAAAPWGANTEYPIVLTNETFFVVGHPDSTVRKGERPVAGQEEWARDWHPGDPTPIRTLGQARPYDLTAKEVAETARVVGEVLVDFVAHTVRPR